MEILDKGKIKEAVRKLGMAAGESRGFLEELEAGLLASPGMRGGSFFFMQKRGFFL